MKLSGHIKKIVLVLALLVISCGIIYRFTLKENNPGYRTVKLQRGDIISTIQSTGTLNPVNLVHVGSQVSGDIKYLYADFNSVVKKDQVIARIDPMLFKAEIEKVRANYKSTLAGVEKARISVIDTVRTLKRYKALLKEDLISQSDVDAAQTSYDSAVAQLEVAKAQAEQNRAALDYARTRLDHTIIRSPVDGIVLSRNVDVGQTVAASFQTPTLFVIAQDLTKMQVNTSVDEADIGQVEMGQKVTFSVDAYPSEIFEGSVLQIRSAPQMEQNVVTYDVIIEVENPELKLKPGMTANVSTIVAEKKDVLSIPGAALRFRPPKKGIKSPQSPGINGGKGVQKRVWVLLPDEKLKSVYVKLGTNNLRYYELVDGDLKEGDNLVIGMMEEEQAYKSGAKGFNMYRAARRYSR